MFTLIIATRNLHKVQEIRAVLSDSVFCRTLNDFPGVPDLMEDAGTFAGNATKKAVALARWLAAQSGSVVAQGGGSGGGSRAFCLADDSGLEVDALAGAPGVHSARFASLESGAANNSSDAANNAKLLRLLAAVPPERRTARFRCVLALTPVPAVAPATASPVCEADEAELGTELFQGTCDGHIDVDAHGTGGFGYDPLFIPNGFTQSFAEVGEEIKNQISHRARALHKLQEWLRG